MNGVVNGTPVDAANTNPKFFMTDGDSEGTAHYKLNGTDTAQGNSVTDIQTEMNSVASFLGKALNGLKNMLPTWTNSEGFNTTDDVKTRADLISAKFNATSGHKHSGAAGDAPKISLNSDVDNTLPVANGGTGQTTVQAAINALVGGVVTVRKFLRGDGTNVTMGSIQVDDVPALPYDPTGSAATVQGNLNTHTGLSGTSVHGLGSASTHSSTDFEPAGAVSTHAGLTSGVHGLGTAAAKAIADFVQSALAWIGALATDSTTTGSSQTLATPATLMVRLTNASLVSITGITAPASVIVFILVNRTGNKITLLNAAGTAANRILTGTSVNLELDINASVWLAYDLTTAKWEVVGGSGGGGGGALYPTTSYGSPNTYNNSGAVAPLVKQRQVIFIGGNAAAVTLNTSTAISASGLENLSELILVGTSDTNTVTIPDGAQTLLNGDCTLMDKQAIGLVWLLDLSLWKEMWRN